MKLTEKLPPAESWKHDWHKASAAPARRNVGDWCENELFADIAESDAISPSETSNSAAAQVA